MPFTSNDLLAIKAELTNNPLSLSGYLPLTNPDNDEANANAMNLSRETLLVDRQNVNSNDLKKAINRVEYNAATLADRQWIDMQLSAGLVDTSPGEVRTGFLAIFGAATATRGNIQAILTESTNRVEHMFRNGLLSVGGVVTPSDVSNARNAV